MATQLLVVLFLAITARTLGDSVTDGTNLVSAFVLHRHGDRTPIQQTLAYSTNPDALAAASEQYGYGQLTTLGMQRAYHLGKTIRARYGELLSDHYNRSEIYIRSTDSTRTKMTVLLAMAAVFPAYPGSWSNEVNWVPAPYTTVPAKYDFNEATLNCPTFMSSFSSRMMEPDNPRMSPYYGVLNIVSEQLGFNITSMPNIAGSVYDVAISQLHLGIPLSDEMAAILPELADAADVSMDILYGKEDYIAYQAGPLLNGFFTYADQQIAGSDTPRVRIYSAHDVNVYPFMAVSQITPRQGVPKYASAFTLEIRQVVKTGEYVVLPVYQPSPGEDLVYLPVVGCGNLLCPYETFKKIVSPYVLDEDTWRNKCGFTNDLVVDDSSVA